MGVSYGADADNLAISAAEDVDISEDIEKFKMPVLEEPQGTLPWLSTHPKPNR